MAKRVCKECVACKKFYSRPCSQPAPLLSELRVKLTFPFAIIGLEYAGPLFAIDQLSRKLYILLFTCAVTRSVHLELTDSQYLIVFWPCVDFLPGVNFHL